VEVRRVRYGRVNDVRCIPRARRPQARVLSESAQGFRRRDQFVRAAVPVLLRAGPASAMFRGV
jgi:hypothetical protein